jgi:predicted phage terminase large subunit-like protein
VKTIRDKISRAYQLQAKFENAEILFPRGRAEDLIEELLLFPEADHDDLFDALELAVSRSRLFLNPFPKGLPEVGPEGGQNHI